MQTNILVIQAHPDKSRAHLCHALADAYTEGATRAGHEVRHIHIADLDFPLITSEHQWEKDPIPVKQGAGYDFCHSYLVANGCAHFPQNLKV